MGTKANMVFSHLRRPSLLAQKFEISKGPEAQRQASTSAMQDSAFRVGWFDIFAQPRLALSKMITERNQAQPDRDTDPYLDMLERTGCQPLNDLVLQCYQSTKDWRLCQQQVQAFRDCFQRHLESLERRKG